MKRQIPTFKSPTLAPGTATAGEFRSVPIADVHVLENLNLRVRGPEYEAAVDEFAASIEANGFYDDKPLAGYVDAKGEVIVVDGHRRLEAAQRLNDRSLDGDVVTHIPVVLKPEDSTIADLTVAMIQSSTGQALTMFEKGIGVRRLMADGMEKDEIARRLGVTTKSVDNYLAVASVSAKARDLLLDGRITSTQALRAKGNADKLQAMVDKATSKGRTRARPSDAVVEGATDNGVAPATPAEQKEGAQRYVGKSPALAAPYTHADPYKAFADALSPDNSFTVDIVKDAEMGAMMRQIANEIRSRVQHDQGDSDAALVSGTIAVSIALTPVEQPKRKRSKVKAPPVTSDEPLDQGSTTPAPDLGPDDPIPDELAHAIPADEL